MNYKIRLVEENDIPQITDLFNEVVTEGNTFLTDTHLTSEQMKSRLSNEEKVSYVLELSDNGINEIIGCYMIRPNLKGRGNHIANATYMIKKGSRKLGFGYQLGKHSLQIAKEHGFIGMQFNSVVSSNLPSVNLWNKLDFKTVGKVENGFRLKNGSLEDILIVYKKL